MGMGGGIDYWGVWWNQSGKVMEKGSSDISQLCTYCMRASMGMAWAWLHSHGSGPRERRQRVHPYGRNDCISILHYFISIQGLDE